MRFVELDYDSISFDGVDISKLGLHDLGEVLLMRLFTVQQFSELLCSQYTYSMLGTVSDI